MLRIYSVALEMVREVRVLADRIQQVDRDHARQLRRSCMSVPLNISEGSAARDGRRRARYTDALGSARETLANLEVAEAAGYIGASTRSCGGGSTTSSARWFATCTRSAARRPRS
jgi:four helix bundle protein